MTSPNKPFEPCEDLTSHAISLLNHIETQVRLFDTKASLLLAANAFLTGAVLTAVSDFNLDGWRITVALALLAAAIFTALYSVFPIWRHEPVDNLFFFTTIAQKDDAAAYSQAYTELSEEKVRDEVAKSVYGKAKWATLKFKCVRTAAYLTAASVFFVAYAIGMALYHDELQAPQEVDATERVEAKIDSLEAAVAGYHRETPRNEAPAQSGTGTSATCDE